MKEKHALRGHIISVLISATSATDLHLLLVQSKYAHTRMVGHEVVASTLFIFYE